MNLVRCTDQPEWAYSRNGRPLSRRPTHLRDWLHHAVPVRVLRQGAQAAAGSEQHPTVFVSQSAVVVHFMGSRAHVPPARGGVLMLDVPAALQDRKNKTEAINWLMWQMGCVTLYTLTSLQV